MRALSIIQPWAWLIVHGGKNIENRTWSTNFRGHILVHAAKRMRERDYDAALATALTVGGPELANRIPPPEQLQLGGVIGSVEIYDVIEPHLRPQQPVTWHAWDQYGFRLRRPRPLPFVPCKGALWFWAVPTSVLGELERQGEFPHLDPLGGE